MHPDEFGPPPQTAPQRPPSDEFSGQPAVAAPPSKPATATLPPQANRSDEFGTPAPTSRSDEFGKTSSSAPVVRTPGSLHADVGSEVDRVAHEQGIPVWALRAIARLETGGIPNPESTISPAGAVGVMQLMPSTFAGVSKGNITNLHDNVLAGATYFKTQLEKYKDLGLAAAAYNAGPGAVDAWLAGKAPLPKETADYMASFTHLQTPMDQALIIHPASPGYSAAKSAEVSKAAATQTDDSEHNQDPEKAKYAWYDQYFGHQDLPFILDNAHVMDQLFPKEGHFQKALHMWATNPAAAADAYGDNAKTVLQALAEMPPQSDPLLESRREYARALLANPLLTMGATFLEEFANPMSWVEGGVLGKAFGVAHGLLQTTRTGRYATHLFSPYREIVARHGENARNMLWQTGQLMRSAEKPTRSTVDKIFGGLTQYEQWEVVRLSQGSQPHAMFANASGKRADLYRRAANLRADITHVTQQKVKHGTLKFGQVYDVQTYFPMRGTFDNPIYDDETMNFLDQMRPGVGSRPPTPESLHERKYTTVDDAVATGNLNLMKTSAATQYYKFRKAAFENIHFEKGLQRIAARYPDMIQIGNVVGNKMTRNLTQGAPLDRWGRQMVHLPDKMGELASPTLNNAWVSKEFADWFYSRRAPGTLTGWSDNEALGKALGAVHAINTAQRNFMIFNPLWHPFNNVSQNAAQTMRQGIPGIVRNYVRAMLGTAFSVADLSRNIPKVGPMLGGHLDALEKHFWHGSQEYAQAISKAIAAGAEAHFGSARSALGGDAIRLSTLAKTELQGWEGLDRFLTEAMDWNTKSTFDARGENQFLAEVYSYWHDVKGLAPEDAAWASREALGHYANVDPNSWASKAILFYPWLKGNMPFWIKGMLTNPKYPRAATESIRKQNIQRGDPKAFDPSYRENPSSVYLGKDEQGRDKRFTIPFPWKDAEKVGRIFDPSGEESFEDRLSVAYDIFSTRARPGLSILFDTILTMKSDKADERGTYRGYEVMYNKDDPTFQQVKEWGMSIIEKSGVFPAPFLVKDLIDNGYQADRLGDYAVQLAGLGSITRTDSDEVKATTRVYKNKLAKALTKLWTAHQAGDMTWDDYTTQRDEVVKEFHDELKAEKDRLTTAALKGKHQ